MRPASVVRFEWCYLAAIVIGLINTALTWNSLRGIMGNDPRISQSVITGTVIASVVFSYGLSLLLWYLTARRRSNVARMIVTVFFAIGLVSTLWSVSQTGYPMTLIGALGAVALLLQAAGIFFLFRPDANAWFARPAAEPIGSTFE